MKNNIVDMQQYKFEKSIGIMMFRPTSSDDSDLTYMLGVERYDPDIVICIETPVSHLDLYEVLEDKYRYHELFYLDEISAAVIFSKYPVDLVGLLALADNQPLVFNLKVGPDYEGLNIVYITGEILAHVQNLSELWFSGDMSEAAFYVDHAYMISKGMDIISQDNEKDMANTNMKVVYYNFKKRSSK